MFKVTYIRIRGRYKMHLCVNNLTITTNFAIKVNWRI